MFRFLRWLREALEERRRRTDVEILWPTLKQLAPDLASARAAFFLHATTDPVWQILGDDEIERRIKELT